VPVTVTLYNHTVKRIMSGENAQSDVYKINLYSVLPFDATATTKAAAEAGATQLPTANGYVQNAKDLTNVLVSVVTTNDGRFDADDVVWAAAGGPIAAAFALIYNDSDGGDPPLMHINFDGVQTAPDTTDFKIIWAAAGIISGTTTP
jgi:hypothetical protein